MKDPLRSQVSLRLGCQRSLSWKPGYLVPGTIRMRSQRLGGVSSVAVIKKIIVGACSLARRSS